MIPYRAFHYHHHFPPLLSIFLSDNHTLAKLKQNQTKKRPLYNNLWSYHSFIQLQQLSVEKENVIILGLLLD